VLCDPDALWTLAPEQLADGVAEVIKYGVLGDKALFDLLADGRWHDHMLDVIETCVAAKARLVQEDERDTGSRQLLNLGHTLGHAIEKCSHFAISHGHAVAIGMVYAARMAARLDLCDQSVISRIADTLTANQLPVEAPYSAEQLCEVALSDKKRTGGQITFVLPSRIGDCCLWKAPVEQMPALIKSAVEP